MGTPPHIARVIIDLDVPHLDRTFDYLIPDRLVESVSVGSLVRVRWGNRRLNGWVVALGDHTDHEGRLAPLLRVLSVIPLFTERMLQTYRYLAARYAVNLSQVLSLAIPARRQKIEESLGQIELSLPPTASGDNTSSLWLHDVRLPRAAIQIVPHTESDLLGQLFEECWQSQTPLIVVAPTLFLAKTLHRLLVQKYPSAAVGFQASELPQTARYETHLRALRGEYVAVIGTRAAAWTPFTESAVLAVWDDGSDHYRERRAPTVDVLDVAVARARWEEYGLITASYSRSVKAQMLVESGWSTSSEPSMQAVRANTPRIRLSDPDSFEREGLTALSTLPDAAFKAVREGLGEGPVLVQVLGAGRFVTLPCRSCGNRMHCSGCGHVLEGKQAPQDSAVVCDSCGTRASLQKCPACGEGPIRTLEVGAERVGRELGRAFARVPVVVSSSTGKIRRRIRAIPQIVVATPGAEPFVTGSYAAVIVLEADRVVYSERIDAEEEAARRWFNTFALARPGAPAVLAGEVPERVRVALVRWQPVPLASELLGELREIGLYPTRWVVGLKGPAKAVRETLSALEGEEYPLKPPGPPLVVLGLTGLVAEPEDEDEQVEAIVSCETRQAMSLMRHLKELANQRSLRRAPVVRVRVNPQQFFQ